MICRHILVFVFICVTGIKYGDSAIDCPPLSIKFSDYGFPTCKPAFTIKMEAELAAILKNTRCKGWRKWTVAKDEGCSNPPTLPDGLSLSYPCDCDFEGTCRTSCREGYEMNSDSNIIVCQRNGNWSTLPTCERIRCDPPVFSDPIETVGQCNHTYGDTCKVKCIGKQYRLIGSDKITCYGSWTAVQFPKCEVYCPLPDIPNYLKSQQKCNGSRGEICSFQCADKRQTMSGQTNVRCQPTGQWEEFPECGCNKTKLPVTINLKSCIVAPGKNCSATCARDYVLNTSVSNVECGADGEWKLDTSMKCIRLCPVPALINGTRLVGNCSRREAETCQAECINPDMKLIGSRTFGCRADGSYATFPSCAEPEKCANNVFPDRLRFLGQCKFLFGETCTLGCREPKFVLLGPNKITCLESNGTWTSLPTCVIECKLPDWDSNLDVSQCSPREGERCLVKCKPSTWLEPMVSNILKCQESGEWDIKPTCVKRCPNITLPNGAVFKQPCVNKVGDTCSAECRDSKFKLLPQNVFKCNETGMWDANATTLRRLKCRRMCDAPQLPSHLIFNPNCSFIEPEACALQCTNRSLVVVGQKQVRCTDKGMPFQKPPECQKKCAVKHKYVGGRAVTVTTNCRGRDLANLVCRFSCNDARDVLIGDSTVRCVAGDAPSPTILCKPMCPDPFVPGTYVVVGTCGKFHGNSCRVDCVAPGSLKNGSKSQYMTCSRGNWTRLQPCVQLCDMPNQLHESVELGPCTRELSRTCPIRCKDKEARLFGTPSVKCTSNRAWEYTDAAYCSKICGNPFLPEGLMITGRCDMKEDNRCTVKCKDGYELVGAPEIKCLSTNSWATFPTCAPLCPPIPTHLTPTQCNRRLGELCYFTCRNRLLVMIPNVTHVVCLNGAIWEAAFPRCGSLAVCVPPPDLEFRGPCKPNTECQLKCAYEDYVLNGVQSSFCHLNGTVFPVPNFCLPPVTENCFGNFIPPPLRLKTKPPYLKLKMYYLECEPGYHLRGEDNILCGPGRLWSSPPECRGICELGPVHAAGFDPIAGHCKNFEGFSCSVQCKNRSLSLAYTPAFYCEAKSKWSKEIPQCIVPVASQWTCDKNMLTDAPFNIRQINGTQLSYAATGCKIAGKPYMYGSEIIRCLPGGVWSPFPVCVSTAEMYLCHPPVGLIRSMPCRPSLTVNGNHFPKTYCYVDKNGKPVEVVCTGQGEWHQVP